LQVRQEKSHMLKTRFCREIGIEYPIVSAPLGGGNAGPEIAAAVSEAGGLGLLGMGGLPSAAIREQIRETRKRTAAPFGVGLLLPLLEGGEVEACIEERVPVLFFFWGDIAPHVAKAKRAGIRVLAQVGSVAEAREAAAAGADAIVAQGFEAGGHVRGTTSLTTLVPAVRQAVAPLPVIAAGGIATGRGLVAARALGAEAVSMGTRFLVSEEMRASRDYKLRVIRAHAEDTVHTKLFDIGWPDAAHRVLRNKAVDEWEAAGSPPSGQRPGEGEIVGRMPVGGRMSDVQRYFVGSPAVGFQGDQEYIALYAGESCSLVNDIKPAAEIVRDIVAEAEAVLRELRG
jgi:NAD(P)H-dependent flavin oxidoreductase YrpB (nitropropane dioxygenase family)